MTPKEKHQEEQNELKSLRINRIMECAFNLFSEKGIDTITMNDIAATAEIGVASLYRYFATKDEVAIRTAIWAWEKQRLNILPDLQTSEYEALSGVQQLERIFKMFIGLYETQKTFLRFIYFFDSYCVRQKVSFDRLADYETVILTVQEIVAKSINKGFEDGTLKPSLKPHGKTLYYTYMHTLFSMAQKLSVSGTMLEMDFDVNGKAQMEFLAQLLLDSIRN